MFDAQPNVPESVITILLAEDHNLVREGLRLILENVGDFRIVDEARDGAETIEMAIRWKPDILVLDLALPKQHGFHVLSVLRPQKNTRIIVVTMYSDDATVLEAFRRGATGFVSKDSASRDLISAIRSAHTDRYFIPKKIQALLRQTALNKYDKDKLAMPGLTAREKMILQQTVEGNSNKEVSRRLGISPRTVEKHRANFMKKLGIKSQRDLLRYAYRCGLLHPYLPDAK